MNPKWLVKKLVEEKVSIPKLYWACGEEDFLLDANQDFKNYLDTIGLDVTYEEGPELMIGISEIIILKGA